MVKSIPLVKVLVEIVTAVYIHINFIIKAIKP